MSVDDIAVGERSLAITWADGARREYCHVWLRDNCPCPECFHPEARERILDTLEIPADIAPKQATIESGRLVLRWPDGHATHYRTGWLRAGEEAPRAPILWDATLDIPEMAHREVAAGEAGLVRWLTLVRDYGVAMLREVPSLLELVERIAYPRRTNFGTIFDVVSLPSPNNLAYTDRELRLHTDLPNWEVPPGVQFLHCRENEAIGGESRLADGFAVASRLRHAHPAAFDLLSTVRLPFRFHDDQWDVRFSATPIELGPDGELCAIRHHPALLAPLRLPFELIAPTYDALRTFGRMLESEAQVCRVALQPGMLLAFDNRRVLHGRTAFDANTGRRRLEGCYVDWDEMSSRIRAGSKAPPDGA